MPGLQSVASAIDTPASSSRRASGYGDRVENSTPGSSVATVVPAAPDQGVDVGVAEVRAVVDAGRAELDGELDAGARAELVAVHPQAQTGVPTGREHPPRLLPGERVRAVRLAEDVDPPGVRRAGAQHRPGDQVEVVRAPVGVLRRHRRAPRGTSSRR